MFFQRSSGNTAKPGVTSGKSVCSIGSCSVGGSSRSSLMPCTTLPFHDSDVHTHTHTHRAKYCFWCYQRLVWMTVWIKPQFEFIVSVTELWSLLTNIILRADCVLLGVCLLTVMIWLEICMWSRTTLAGCPSWHHQ